MGVRICMNISTIAIPHSMMSEECIDRGVVCEERFRKVPWHYDVTALRAAFRTAMLVCSLLASETALGELVWRTTSLSRSVDVRQAEVDFQFHFRNTGPDTVTIEELKSSCSCLHPKLEKRTYGSGESGILNVNAHLNGRQGRVKKQVEVVVKGAMKSQSLGVDLYIPRGYVLSTRRLMWQAGDDGPQSCRLVNSMKKPIRLEMATSSSSGFEVELKMIQTGMEYEVCAKPVGEDAVKRGIISIFTESFEGCEPRVYKLYVIKE